MAASSKISTPTRGTLDKPALKPLSGDRYEYAEWKLSRVNIDYHIEVDRHYYSIPYQLIHKEVEVRLNPSTVEVIFAGRRVASHQRNYKKGGFITINEHRPKSHQKHLEWTPSRIIRWAEGIGPSTAEVVKTIMESKSHPLSRDTTGTAASGYCALASSTPQPDWRPHAKGPFLQDLLLQESGLHTQDRARQAQMPLMAEKKSHANFSTEVLDDQQDCRSTIMTRQPPLKLARQHR